MDLDDEVDKDAGTKICGLLIFVAEDEELDDAATARCCLCYILSKLLEMSVPSEDLYRVVYHVISKYERMRNELYGFR